MTPPEKHPAEPAEFLVENIDLLPRGRALDIAMGRGRNAVFLALNGFTVEGVDISPENIELAGNNAKEAGVTLDAHVADLEHDYVIPPESYSAIICFNYLQRSLIPQIINGLQPGGVVVYETYIIDQLQFGHPHNPDFLLEHNELLELFRDLRCLRYREGLLGEEKAIAGIVAEKYTA